MAPATPPPGKASRFQARTGEGQAACLVCERKCRIPEGGMTIPIKGQVYTMSQWEEIRSSFTATESSSPKPRYSPRGF